ncbi:MAG: hypothetical protein IJ106_08010 [Parasporobacterium sp.]|nr:hypothetical protein [Parasporobacterium sp.]
MSTYQERWNRLETAINMGIPDRVPFAPKVSLYYSQLAEASVYDIMKDYRLAAPGIRAYVEAVDPDLVWPPATYPIDPLEVLQAGMLRWPGPTHNIPLNASFQHLDHTWLEDEEFDAFLDDPTGFLMNTILPRKYPPLKGLANIHLNNIYDMSFIMGLDSFAKPEAIEALMALVHAGKHVEDKKKQAGELARFIVQDCGCPTRGATLCAPFDTYADSLRGLVQATMDIYEYPEETLACVERIYDLCIPGAVKAAKAKGEKLVFIPLHSGVDEFMSIENYEKFYWPTLRRTIMEIIRNDMVPYVFCEGKYNTRLEIISDVPKGKVFYMFEQVDIRKAKETVGQVACIGGNFPTTLLISGKKEQIVDETKKMLDICAPGGGFIMDCALIIDNADPVNLETWREATLKYGSY